MVVFYDFGRVIAIEPIYWSGMTIADDQTVGEGLGGDPAERCDSV
jgi:hypothetical protein